MLHKTLA